MGSDDELTEEEITDLIDRHIDRFLCSPSLPEPDAAERQSTTDDQAPDREPGEIGRIGGGDG